MKTTFSRGRLLGMCLLGAIFLFTSGCSKDDDSSGPTAPVITNVNGNWSGKTNQNENVTFTVADNAVTYCSIKIVTPSFTQTSSAWPSSCKVSNNAFSLSIPGSPSVSVSGQFKSNTTSEGTFTLGSTTGTWSASKQ